MSQETLTSLFATKAAERPDDPVLRVKQAGVYGDVTWRELAARVQALAQGLIGLDVQAGDRVGILSENRQEWIEADFAILSVGAITVGLHAPLTGTQVREQFADSAPVAVFVSTAEQRDKLLGVREALPSVRSVIAFDTEAATGDVLSLDALIARGESVSEEEWTRRAEAVQPEDVAAIIYTSGTTGEPKGAMLTHANFVSNVLACEQIYPAVEREWVVLLYLPLSHVYARLCDLYYSLAVHRTIALAESIETLVPNLQETRPHSISGVPRIHEKLAAAARPLVEVGDKEALRRILGGRIEYCGSGGGALSPDVARFYEEAGVPVYQGYGLTETSPVISFNYPDHNKRGSAGLPIAGIEVKIADDGEILSRGPHIMQGYWNKPEATATVIDAEGWFHTGDIGQLDEDGFLYITDRKKDIFVTAYGKNIAPQQIEGLLCFDPYIEQACVYGDGRKYLTALLVPAASVLQVWARENGLGEKSVAELIALPAVRVLYTERVAQALCTLSPYEQVRDFVLLPEPFSFARGEMTVTAKLRRKQVVERYREALDRLYSD